MLLGAKGIVLSLSVPSVSGVSLSPKVYLGSEKTGACHSRHASIRFHDCDLSTEHRMQPIPILQAVPRSLLAESHGSKSCLQPGAL